MGERRVSNGSLFKNSGVIDGDSPWGGSSDEFPIDALVHDLTPSDRPRLPIDHILTRGFRIIVNTVDHVRSALPTKRDTHRDIEGMIKIFPDQGIE